MSISPVKQTNINMEKIGKWSKEEFVELLKDDEFYYGEANDYALSASSFGKLLDGSYHPEMWKEPREWKSYFDVGRYFHVQTLEPHKLHEFDVRDVVRRSPGDTFLKQSEVDNLEAMKVAQDAHIEARGLLYGPNVEYEVPGVVNIDGVWLKGKCDAANPDVNWLVDLKTSSGHMPFYQGAAKYGYNSQAWVYWKIFGMPTKYVTVNKKTHDVQIETPPQSYYKKGKERALEAIKIYKENYV